MPGTRRYHFDDAEGAEHRRQIEELLERAHAADTLPEAIPLLTEAVAIATAHADLLARALCHAAAARVLHSHGRTGDALQEAEAEIALRRQLPNPILLARAIHFLGECHADTGDFEAALRHHLTALRMFTEADDQPELAKLYNDIGVVYHKLVEYPQALKYYWLSHGIAQQIGDAEATGRALGNIGIVQARLQQFDQALETYQQALQLRASVNDDRGVAVVLGSIGNVYAMQGEANTALEFYGRSLAKRDPEKDQRGVAILQRNIAAMLRHLGRHREAVEHCAIAIQLAESLNSRDLLSQFHEEFAMIYEAMGDFQQALNHHKHYAEHYSAMLNIGTQRSVAELQAKYDVERATAEREQFRRRMLEWEHTAFRAQVNPHFLFNALNSIQYFLVSHDSESANRYLSRFARLMRLALENSRSALISLKSELECVGLYMALEQLRFGERLGYSVEVSEEIDEEEVQVPPMIVQPYLENAIWHGLLPRESGGSILLRVAMGEEGDSVLFVIDDNGVGRAASGKGTRERNAPEAKAHRSSGMKMIEERLELIQQATNRPCRVSIADKYDQEGNPLGTRVEIQIPSTLTLDRITNYSP